MKEVAGLIVVFVWIAGIVLASGLLKLIAAILPPYALYLVVERILQMIGFIR